MARQSRTQQVVQNKQGKGHLIQEVLDDNLLPDAAEIEKLHKLDPNILDWLKKRAESEQEFRHNAYQERIELVRCEEKGERRMSTLGMILSFILAVVGITASFFLIYFNHTVTGTVFGGAILVMLASIFLTKVRTPSNNILN